MKKLKVIYFYQYLPPWRIDVFNEIGKHYDLTVAFTDAECEGFTYNRADLLNRLRDIKTVFLNDGFKIGSHPIRFGIFKLIKRIKPDVIFSHEYSPTSILVALYKQLGLFHYSYFLTTSDNLNMAEAVVGMKAMSRKYVLSHSNGLIVYSDAVRQWYSLKFPDLKIKVCPNIQSPQSLLYFRSMFPAYIRKYRQECDLESCNIILYVGRLVEVKGLDLLLSAFAKANVFNYKLVMVGAGNQEESLRRQIRQLGITEKVVFAGFHSGADLYAWYDMANFSILPSRYEPFGAVVNESLVYGCPIIASKYIGATDFITADNGMLFDPLDESDFIHTIRMACRKYSQKTSCRQNLMPCSFDKYVSVFYTISTPK